VFFQKKNKNEKDINRYFLYFYSLKQKPNLAFVKISYSGNFAGFFGC